MNKTLKELSEIKARLQAIEKMVGGFESAIKTQADAFKIQSNIVTLQLAFSILVNSKTMEEARESVKKLKEIAKEI